jgi:hypothetical protein
VSAFAFALLALSSAGQQSTEYPSLAKDLRDLVIKKRVDEISVLANGEITRTKGPGLIAVLEIIPSNPAEIVDLLSECKVTDIEEIFYDTLGSRRHHPFASSRWLCNKPTSDLPKFVTNSSCYDIGYSLNAVPRGEVINLSLWRLDHWVESRCGPEPELPNVAPPSPSPSVKKNDNG